jgi:hypothetical protein
MTLLREKKNKEHIYHILMSIVGDTISTFNDLVQFHIRCHYLGRKHSTKFQNKPCEYSGNLACRPRLPIWEVLQLPVLVLIKILGNFGIKNLMSVMSRGVRTPWIRTCWLLFHGDRLALRAGITELPILCCTLLEYNVLILGHYP